MSGERNGVGDVLAWLQRVAPGARQLRSDSRRVGAGDVFLAIAGRATDGRRHIDAAVGAGAAAVLVQAEGWVAREIGAPMLAVPALDEVQGLLAARFYKSPSEAMLTFGVTGTNGKTSVSQWIAQALGAGGTRCAVIGTVGSGFPDAPLAAAALTTPDAVSLQAEVRRLADAGASALAMEVSSIGLDQGRVRGMQFDVAVFTNLTRDHLDYHGTMQAYEAAKALLFDWPTLSHAVVNLDDAMGGRLLARLRERAHAGALRVIGYTQEERQSDALSERLAARAVRTTADGLAFELHSSAGSLPLALPLVGSFNVSNVMAVAGALLAAGVDFARLPALLAQLRPPPGRMQRVGGRLDAGEPLAVIDYAHTPDALDQALAALRPLAQGRGGQLWVVFGAGGDRDAGKRAPMAEAAARRADRVVITSDNPRTEDPQAIVEAVAAGLPPAASALKIVDRAGAIGRALADADARDVVLIAGKGHEDYQDIGGQKIHFSDVEHAAAALARRSGAEPPPRPLSASPADAVPAPGAPRSPALRERGGVSSADASDTAAGKGSGGSRRSVLC